ncbi:MAG: CDP-glucose 4,6-dehydratase [Saprospiraceae bacterium]|nr:CDP-glucose 4,6-dehydratase [Saprospiraceae bacterium]
MAVRKSGMEVMVKEQLKIYKNKKVFVTGHTGFKGSWLVLALQELGCEVHGYALNSDSIPNHYGLHTLNIHSTISDIRNSESLQKALQESQAEIVFHLAAQSLVRPSYSDPVYTYDVNVMGSLHLLNAVRSCEHVRAVLMITTDKVYDNREMDYAYNETDRLGGYDMYSSSKACCEILISSFRNSFFNHKQYGIEHQVLITSVRAGNVIGGGDWSVDRLIPDIMKATAKEQKVILRNPTAIRPWQHVLDCLGGYLLLGAHLLNKEIAIAKAWNIAPEKNEASSVEKIIQLAQNYWPKIQYEIQSVAGNVHEAQLLMLDNAEIKEKLQWRPIYTTQEAVELTVSWYQSYYEDNKVVTSQQIRNFFNHSWN